MPILDQRTTIVLDTAITGTVGTALIGSQIDLGAAHRDIGSGRTVWANFLVTTAFVGASGFVELQIVTDAAAAIAVDGSATVHASSGTVGVAGWPINKLLSLALPFEGSVYERYLGLLAVRSGATISAGKVSCFLSPDPVGSWQAYPEATS